MNKINKKRKIDALRAERDALRAERDAHRDAVAKIRAELGNISDFDDVGGPDSQCMHRVFEIIDDAWPELRV